MTHVKLGPVNLHEDSIDNFISLQRIILIILLVYKRIILIILIILLVYKRIILIILLVCVGIILINMLISKRIILVTAFFLLTAIYK